MSDSSRFSGTREQTFFAVVHSGFRSGWQSTPNRLIRLVVHLPFFDYLQITERLPLALPHNSGPSCNRSENQLSRRRGKSDCYTSFPAMRTTLAIVPARVTETPGVEGPCAMTHPSFSHRQRLTDTHELYRSNCVALHLPVFLISSSSKVIRHHRDNFNLFFISAPFSSIISSAPALNRHLLLISASLSSTII